MNKMINKLIKLFQKKQIKQEIKQEDLDKLKKDLDKLKKDLLEVFKETDFMLKKVVLYIDSVNSYLTSLTRYDAKAYNESIAEQFISFSQTYYKLNDKQKSEMLLLYRNNKRQDKSYKINSQQYAYNLIHDEMAVFLCSEVEKLSEAKYGIKTFILPRFDYYNYDDYLTGKK